MRCFCDKSLAQIVISDAGSVEVLEKYSLDYSCRGNKTLREACHERSIRVETVAAELKCMRHEPGVQADSLPFEKLSLASLVDYIVHTHHDYLRTQLPRMRRQLWDIVGAGGDGDPAQVLVAFGKLESELMRHLAIEESIIFKRIRQIEYLASGCNPNPGKATISGLHAPVALMLEQHEYSDRLLLSLLQKCLELSEEWSHGWKLQSFNQSLKALEADIHIHMHLENNILFPRAISLNEKLGRGPV